MVSECLLGHNCKYNGGNNLHNKLIDVLKNHKTIPVCPETLGGLESPRAPSEIVDGVVISKEGKNVDKEFRKGANTSIEIALKEKPDIIILQSRSPSCGVKEIYDGTFTGTKIPGMGVFARLAKEAGFNVVDVEDEECWMAELQMGFRKCGTKG